MFNTVEGVLYSGGIPSVLWWRDTIRTVEGYYTSTVEDVEYCLGYSVVWKMFITVEVLLCCWYCHYCADYLSSTDDIRHCAKDPPQYSLFPSTDFDMLYRRY